MSTSAGERLGLGSAAKLVGERASALVRLELQLAGAELKKKAAAVGLGLALLAAAAVFAVFALGFALATIAAAVATAVSTWLALLIVTGALFGMIALLVVLGIHYLKKGTPPIPEQAIAEAKLTTEALKNGKH